MSSGTTSERFRALSPRHERRKNEIKSRLETRYVHRPTGYLEGVIEGMRLAIMAMYPTIDEFFGQDQQATELTLTALAVKEMVPH